MAIKFETTKFPQMEIGNLLAQNYGEHILSVEIEEDTPNGYICKLGKMKKLDLWTKEEATAINAYIALKDAAGRFLVVINDPKDCAVIYTKPLNPYENPKALANANFYNDPADGPVRAYELHKHDRFWLTADAFDGEEPEVGKDITTVTNGKLVVPA